MSVKTKASRFCDGASSYLLFALCLTSYLGTCVSASARYDAHVKRPEVTIPQGTLRGVNMVTSENRTVYGFTGVPYAQPPVGDLRFKAPLAPSAWNGTYDASTNGALCFQIGPDGNVIGDEDCLYIHIYTPKLPSKKKTTLLPVMFFIVGGGFKEEVDNKTRYGPDFLLNNDVVLVVPTFRVGALGFLSTGDEVAPGNWGMKDVVRALEWNRDNIKYFGGDPDQVTLLGGSSGAMMTSFLTLTNATEGLFHKYITHSGTAHNPMLQEPKESYAERSILLGESFGCPTNTSTLLVDCLRGLNGSQLVDTKSLFYEWKSFPDHVWHPTVEPAIEGALITEIPARLMTAGRSHNLPWINTNVRNEGNFATLEFDLDSTLFEEVLENIDVALPLVIGYSRTVRNVTAYTDALKLYYLNDLSADRSLLLNNLTQLFSDFAFFYPSYRALREHLHFSTSPQYYLSFEYRGVFDYSYYYSGGLTNYTGTWHGDENIYLFNDQNNYYGPPSDRYSKTDLTLVRKMVNMWTSFATNGEPTPADAYGKVLWEPYSRSENYLQVGNDSELVFEVKYSPHKERMQFWDELVAAIPWK